MDFDDSLHLARVLSGEMAVVDSNETMQDMITSFKRVNADCGGSFNTGYTDREEEGTFVNVNTREPLTWNFWNQGEPNNWGGNKDCTNFKSSRPQLVHTGREYLDCFNEEWFSTHHF